MKDELLYYDCIRQLINFDFFYTSPSAVELYIKKYLKLVTTSQDDKLFLLESQDIKKQWMTQLLPEIQSDPKNRVLGDLIIKILPKNIRQIFFDAAVNYSYSWNDSRFLDGSVRAGSNSIRDLLKNESDVKIYGTYLNYGYSSIRGQYSQLSIAIYDVNELNSLCGAISKKKTEVVALGPELQHNTGKSTKVLTEILEKILEEEIRTKQPYSE